MDFACEHCGAKVLRMVAVAEKTISFECLSCSKETTFERRPKLVPVANPSMSEQGNMAFPFKRTLTAEQAAKHLAMKHHLSLAQANGLVSRFGSDSDKLNAAVRRMKH